MPVSVHNFDGETFQCSKIKHDKSKSVKILVISDTAVAEQPLFVLHDYFSPQLNKMLFRPVSFSGPTVFFYIWRK